MTFEISDICQVRRVRIAQFDPDSGKDGGGRFHGEVDAFLCFG